MKYDYKKIENCCNQMRNINIDMKKQFDIIQNSFKQVNNNWTGKASEYYLNEIRDFSSEMEDFYRELNACVAFLQKCSDSYESLDKKFKQEIDDIVNGSKIFN